MVHQTLDHLSDVEHDHTRRFPNEFPLFEATLQEKFDRTKHRIEEFQALVQTVCDNLSWILCITFRSNIIPELVCDFIRYNTFLAVEQLYLIPDDINWYLNINKQLYFLSTCHSITLAILLGAIAWIRTWYNF